MRSLPTCAALALVVWLVAPTPRAPVSRCARAESAAPRESEAAACGRCHVEDFREWKASAHANAWTDPVYQRALVGKPRPELCHGCHIPSDVSKRLGKRPDARKVALEDGVHCVACHRSGATMLGPFGSTTDAHPSEKDPAFSAPGANALCASCHATKIGPVLPLARDFEAAGVGERGKSCIGCHMPERTRPIAFDPVTGRPTGSSRATRSHAMRGPGDAEFCATAFDVAVRRSGEEIVITITNAAGHRVPGLVGRKFLVRARQLDDSDREVRKQDGTEISSDNELRCRETREVRFLAASGMSSIEVTIEHHASDKPVATILQKAWRP